MSSRQIMGEYGINDEMKYNLGCWKIRMLCDEKTALLKTCFIKILLNRCELLFNIVKMEFGCLLASFKKS
jgi:hypothetical protein